MKPHPYVLFDFDGVIADTEGSNLRYWEEAFRFYQIRLTDADKRKLLGRKDKSCLADLLAKSGAGISWEEVRERRRKLGNVYEDGTILPFPGAADYLLWLRKSGRKTALVTSTSARLIVTALNRMGLTTSFDVIVCGDMCPQSKPDPAIYQMAMALLGGVPRDCLVIEDSEAGIRAGKNAGAAVLAFRGSEIVQDTHEADYQADTYAEVRRLNL